MTRLSTDLKVMLRSYEGHTFILVVIDEVTNFMVTIPIYWSRLEWISDALRKHVFNKYSIPDCMIMYQDSAFTSALIDCLFKKLGIKIKTVAPHNHHTIQAEQGIKSLAIILMKHLTASSQYWPNAYHFKCKVIILFVVQI